MGAGPGSASQPEVAIRRQRVRARRVSLLQGWASRVLAACWRRGREGRGRGGRTKGTTDARGPRPLTFLPSITTSTAWRPRPNHSLRMPRPGSILCSASRLGTPIACLSSPTFHRSPLPSDGPAGGYGLSSSSAFAGYEIRGVHWYCIRYIEPLSLRIQRFFETTRSSDRVRSVSTQLEGPNPKRRYSWPPRG